MSTTTSSVTLNQVPTGYGGYTGVCLTNSGNFPVQYSISVSETAFDSSVTPAKAIGGVVNNTIYISDNVENPDLNSSTIVKNVNANDSGVFYILHRPFTNFSLPAYYSTGIESARVSIATTSSVGDNDGTLSIYVTGQRVTGLPIPNKMVEFYAVKDYSPQANVSSNGVLLQFNWKCQDRFNYYSGFRLDLATDSSFSSYTTDYFGVTKNSNSNLPNYGTYNGFYNQQYSLTKSNLAISQNYYARLCPVNITGGTGEFVYPEVYNEYYPILSDEVLSGVVPYPGDNLKLDPTGWYLNYSSDYVENFDLFEYLYKQNNNSADFTKYSGINIKFTRNKSTSLSQMVSSTVKSGAINFVNTNNRPIGFSVDGSYVFKLEMEFENVGLYGCGGDGGIQQSNNVFTNAGNGGAIFNLDYIAYQDPSDSTKTRSIQYYIYKDVDSIFYAGAAGSAGVIVTDTTDNQVQAVINGTTIKNMTSINLSQVHYP